LGDESFGLLVTFRANIFYSPVMKLGGRPARRLFSIDPVNL